MYTTCYIRYICIHYSLHRRSVSRLISRLSLACKLRFKTFWLNSSNKWSLYCQVYQVSKSLIMYERRKHHSRKPKKNNFQKRWQISGTTFHPKFAVRRWIPGIGNTETFSGFKDAHEKFRYWSQLGRFQTSNASKFQRKSHQHTLILHNWGRCGGYF